jgi:hypothetical protein
LAKFIEPGPFFQLGKNRDRVSEIDTTCGGANALARCSSRGVFGAGLRGVGSVLRWELAHTPRIPSTASYLRWARALKEVARDHPEWSRSAARQAMRLPCHCEKGHHIQEGRFAAGIRPNQDLELAQRLAHVTKTAESLGFDEADHG